LSINWQSDAEPKPGILVLPPDAASLDEAHAAIEQWEHYSGKRLDAIQRLTVEVMMAETSIGRWAARTTGREMARQNGKGDELEVVESWGLTQRGEAIVHTAHELSTVSSAHQRMVAFLEGHADLRRRIRKVLNGIGQQMIETKAGVIQYKTRTKGGGRGLDDISRLVIDEAQHAQPEQLASSTPILFANPNPQMNFAGTGAIDGVSDWWWDLRKRALMPNPGAFGYVGHTADRVTVAPDGKVTQESVDATDRALWYLANPALGAGRGEIEFLEEQFRTLGPELFAREHLCVWDPPAEGSTGPISPDAWAALADADSRIASNHCFAIDVSEDRKWASIGVAGRRSDGLLHVEVVDRRAGVHWLADKVVDVWNAQRVPFRIERGSPAASFIPILSELGVEVADVSTAEHAQAVGMVVDAVNASTLRHLGGVYLSSAVAAADVRHSSDAAVWARRNAKSDITPLVAVTLAAGGVPSPQLVPQVWSWSLATEARGGR
jgi:hypothetical protein